MSALRAIAAACPPGRIPLGRAPGLDALQGGVHSPRRSNEAFGRAEVAMRIGVVFPQVEIGQDPSAIRDCAQAVEAMGYTHVLVFDHVLGAKPERPGGWKGPTPFGTRSTSRWSCSDFWPPPPDVWSSSPAS